MDPTRVLTIYEVARGLGISVSALLQWEKKLDPPLGLAIRTGRVTEYRYRLGDVLAIRCTTQGNVRALVALATLADATGIPHHVLAAWVAEGNLPPHRSARTRINLYSITDVRRHMLKLYREKHPL